jgi:two-component system nitrate/nitrite response regulator NarL
MVGHGDVMGPSLTTVIVEPRLLVREALEALMISHSYRVICGAASTADIDGSLTAADEPKLVILGTLSADHAVTEAFAIRKRWPKSKIVLLFEDAGLVNSQKFLASEIDGCVSLSVSPDTLISTLKLILIRDVRAMVVTGANSPAIEPSGPTEPARTESPLQPGTGTDKPRSAGAEHANMATHVLNAIEPLQLALNGAGAVNPGANSDGTGTILAGLSERELQILDGLVQGHANKVIARMYDITEATVKVHMKSILRKIRVTNRTQAAIWAVENGFSAD